MSTKDIENEANVATESLLALSEAGKKAAKQRKKEIEEARKRQDKIDYAARLAKRAEQDKIDEAEEVLSQIDPDMPSTPPPAPSPNPAPVVESELTPADNPKPEPKVIEKEVPVPDPETERKLKEESERADKLQRELDEARRNTLNEREEKEAATLVTSELPKQPKKLTVADRVNPNNWGWISWLLAAIGLILGWTIVGEWLEIQSQPSLWDWLAWCFRPASAGIGFFGGGLIGHIIAEKLSQQRSARA